MLVTGDAIGPGHTIDLGGGGIWFGCLRMHVLDSTVTLNTAPIGAGIEGEPESQLELDNSIVAKGSSGAPLPGRGNMCANPLLADGGNASSLDVHETASSPTIGAGSTALLPAGLTKDFYGSERVRSSGAGGTSCGAPPGGKSPVLDMGASEFEPAPPAPIACGTPGEPVPPESGNPPPTNPTQPQPTTKTQAQASTQPQGQGPTQTQGQGSARPPASSPLPSPSLRRRAAGRLLLAFAGLAGGELRVRATYARASDGHGGTGSSGDRHELGTLTYGYAAAQLGSPAAVTLGITPTRRALADLARRKRPQLELSIAFTRAGAAPVVRTEIISVSYGASRASCGRSPSKDLGRLSEA